MSEKQKPIIALCYDFDGTLIRGNMQENSFIPDLGMEEFVFWAETKKNAKDHDMDEVLAYMQLMLNKSAGVEKRLSKATLERYGSKLKGFFPGVLEWFGVINQKYSEQAQIEHYVISSGIDEMIQSSKIGKEFKHIFASGFVYDDDKIAIFPARSVNYTTKVQYLFRIHKNILNAWDNSTINANTPPTDRRVLFSQMIYLGDGDTDVPTMKMVNYQGGYSIAVYPTPKGEIRTEAETKKKESVEELQEDKRCQFIAEADYTKDKRLYELVVFLIERIINERKFNMNLEA